MHRSISIVLSLVLSACAAAPIADPFSASAGAPERHLAIGDVRLPGPSLTGTSSESPEASAPSLASAELAESPAGFDMTRTISSEALEPMPLAPTAEEGESLHGSRFTIKAGHYSAEDTDALDDGYIINVAWMRFFSSLFAIEFEAGYIDADGEDGGIDTDLFAIPLMVNGRLNIPIWVIDLYGGVGVGTIYYDADSSVGDADGWLTAGNAFLGGTVNLGDSIALGLEGKYYVTDEIDDLDGGLDAFALMLTLGFSR